MARRFLGVGFGTSLVAFATYGAGCTSSHGGATAEAGDGGIETGVLHRDAEPAGDTGDGDGSWISPGDDCPSPAPTKADLDQPDGAPGWNPPAPRQTTACSTADLQKLSDNLDSHDLHTLQAWDDLVVGLPTSCAQCLLSRDVDASWQLFVTDAPGKNGFVNRGACYADAPHGSAACGQAEQYLAFCVDIACNGCAAPDLFDSCIASKAVTNACEAVFGPGIQAACAQAYAQELDAQCGRILDAAAIVCGDGVLPDGGKLTD